jgi:hypothetical protein
MGSLRVSIGVAIVFVFAFFLVLFVIILFFVVWPLSNQYIDSRRAIIRAGSNEF